MLKASSLSADEALKGGVIEVVAVDVKDLLRQIDGRTVTLPAGKAKLELAGAPVETLEPDWRTKVLAVLSNPMLAMVLMMVGIYGLFVEFTSPGFGVPGIAGAISLLLALYAFHMLPVNWAGVALIALGLALMISEVFLPSFGALGVGGFIAFIVGGLMLFDADHPIIDVSLPFVFGLAITSAAAIAAFGAFAMKSRRRPIVSGREEMVGATGVITTIDEGSAWAEVHGERWRVRSSTPLAAGDRVRVTGIDGLTLEVTDSISRELTMLFDLPIGYGAAVALLLVPGLFDVSHPARVRARRRVPAGPLLEGQGPGTGDHHSRHPADGAGRPARRDDGRAAAGRDLARQRLGQGQCRRFLPCRRSAEGDHPGRDTTWLRPASSRRRHCVSCSASTNSTRCWQNANG